MSDGIIKCHFYLTEAYSKQFNEDESFRNR